MLQAENPRLTNERVEDCSMRKKRINIQLGSAGRKTVYADSEKRIGELIAAIQAYAATVEQFPRTDSNGKPIVYALYPEPSADSIPLIRSQKIGFYNFQEGHILYFTEHGKPPAPSPPATTIPDSPPLPSLAPKKVLICLDAQQMLEIDPTKGLALDRKFVMDHLPWFTVLTQRLREKLGFSTRLGSVSRKLHCEIFRDASTGWMLKAHKPVHIPAMKVHLNGGAELQLTHDLSIVLGKDGWPVDIFLM